MRDRKLLGGLVGGGLGSFIGPVHRMAGILDGQADFVAGALSSNPEKSKRSGKKIYFDPARVYSNYRDMAEKEASLPAGKRIDFVSITTPNVYHFDIAKTFLEAGFHVICDKPMTCTLAEARKLRKIVAQTGKVFALTYTYTGYPMVKQARFMVSSGMLGTINKVVVEYPQGWLSRFLEDTAETWRTQVWRLNPELSGAFCTVGDIGTHAENLARYITGFKIKELCADLSSFIPGNVLDEEGSVLLHYIGGAEGLLHISQVSTGEENGLNIKIYGTRMGLYWNQDSANYLAAKMPNGQSVTYSKGAPFLCDESKQASRLPLGHPEGVIEAFANIYREAYKAIRAAMRGESHEGYDFPTVDDGVIGMAFIESVLVSAASQHKWTLMKR